MTSYKRSSFARSVINTVKDMTGNASYLVCNCCEQRKKMSKEGKERREKERKKKGGRKEGERKKENTKLKGRMKEERKTERKTERQKDKKAQSPDFGRIRYQMFFPTSISKVILSGGLSPILIFSGFSISSMCHTSFNSFPPSFCILNPKVITASFSFSVMMTMHQYNTSDVAASP